MRRRPALPILCALAVVLALGGSCDASGSDAAPDVTSGTTFPAEKSSAQVEISSLSRRLFISPEDFGAGYAASDRDDYVGPARARSGGPQVQYHVTQIDETCRPTEWTEVMPDEWAFRWYEAPDGGFGSEELHLMRSAEDAAALVDSARFTLGASMTNRACHRKNLMAPTDGAEPDAYVPTYPVYDIDPACPVGDDCHAVVTELDPCVDGPDGKICAQVTNVFFHVGPVVVSMLYTAPEGAARSIPIADLIPASQRAAELIRAG